MEVKTIFFFQNKKYIIVIVLFITLLTLFFYSRNNQSISTDDKTKKEKIIDNNGNDIQEKKDPNNNRLIKLHLLEKNRDSIDLKKESRNIFLAKKNEKNINKQEIKEEEKFATLQIPQIPQFPYKLIGVVRIYKSSNYTKFAVFFNGSENVFVKEGEMIDPIFQLIKINEDDVDVMYLEYNTLIKVEIKGS